jgi:hypothetical protein
MMTAVAARMQGQSCPRTACDGRGRDPRSRPLSITDAIPAGLCQCGCGQQTQIASSSCARRGYTKGEPHRYLHGHAGRKAQPYRVEDRGYETPCWIWQLALGKDGHGRTSVDRVTRFAHVAYYERAFGPVEKGMHLHHKCEQPPCVNPDHLAVFTPAQHRQEHSRLTWEHVQEIRARNSNGEKRSSLAAAFGLSLSGLDHIVKNRRWRES